MTKAFNETLLRMVRRVHARNKSGIPLTAVEAFSLRKALTVAGELEVQAAAHGVFPDYAIPAGEVLAEALALTVE